MSRNNHENPMSAVRPAETITAVAEQALEYIKPEDIVKPENAVSFLSSHYEGFTKIPFAWRIKAVLRLGLLGTPSMPFIEEKHELEKALAAKFNTYDEFEEAFKRIWFKNSKEKKSIVHVNILGRDISDIEDAYFRSQTGVGFVSNLHSFEESNPPAHWNGAVEGEAVLLTGVKKFRGRDSHTNFNNIYLIQTFFEKYGETPNSRRRFIENSIQRFVETILYKTKQIHQSLSYQDLLEALYTCKKDHAEFGLTEEEYQSLYDKVIEKGNYQNLFGDPHDDTGFMVSNRIPPRDIKAIIVDTEKDGFAQIMYDIEGVQADMNRGVESPHFFPIYNLRGDLIWPKKVSHQEILLANKVQTDREGSQ